MSCQSHPHPPKSLSDGMKRDDRFAFYISGGPKWHAGWILEVVLPTVLSLQSDCASAGTQTLLFLWCMENFWRRALVEPVCIASKPSNSSSSYFSCCPPIPIPIPSPLPSSPLALTSPALACKTHGRNLPDIVGGTFGPRLLHLTVPPTGHLDVFSLLSALKHILPVISSTR